MLMYPVTIKLKIVFEKEELENAGFLNKLRFDTLIVTTLFTLNSQKVSKNTNLCR